MMQIGVIQSHSQPDLLKVPSMVFVPKQTNKQELVSSVGLLRLSEIKINEGKFASLPDCLTQLFWMEALRLNCPSSYSSTDITLGTALPCRSERFWQHTLFSFPLPGVNLQSYELPFPLLKEVLWRAEEQIPGKRAAAASSKTLSCHWAAARFWQKRNSSAVSPRRRKAAATFPSVCPFSTLSLAHLVPPLWHEGTGTVSGDRDLTARTWKLSLLWLIRTSNE